MNSIRPTEAPPAGSSRAVWRPVLAMLGAFTLLAALLWWRFGQTLYIDAVFAAIAACF